MGSPFTVYEMFSKDELKWHAWKPHYRQALYAEDCYNRVEFGEVMLAWYEEWFGLSKSILWSNEAVFGIDGFVNHHNCYYCA